MEIPLINIFPSAEGVLVNPCLSLILDNSKSGFTVEKRLIKNHKKGTF